MDFGRNGIMRKQNRGYSLLQNQIEAGDYSMKVEVLLSTMNQNDYEILDRINLQTSAVVVNQCDRNEVKEITYKGQRIIWVDTVQRGLSKSRNMALSFACGDICLIADEDETLVDGYEALVLRAFTDTQQADIVSFNFDRVYPKGAKQDRKDPNRKENNSRKAPYFKYYSSVSLAFRRMKIVKHGIHFNELIGAGTEYGSGEEALFLIACRNSKLKVYENPSKICSVDCSDSSWFKGYDEKFYYNKGIFLGAAYGKIAKIMSLYFLKQSRSISELDLKTVLANMNEGIKAYREL